MSQKELDRLQVLHEAQGRHLTQQQAAGQLGLTDRWVRKLLGRLRREGDRGVVAFLQPQAHDGSEREFGVPARSPRELPQVVTNGATLSFSGPGFHRGRRFVVCPWAAGPMASGDWMFRDLTPMR